MIIIGERINASRPPIKKAIENKDKAFLQNEAKAQRDAGSTFLDLNCAISTENEVQDMEWLVETIEEVVSIPLCIDSPNPSAIASGVKKSRGNALINSITAEESRYKHIIPLATKYKCSVIALTMDSNGMPKTSLDRYEIAKGIYTLLKREGLQDEQIYFDPLVRPISSEPEQAMELISSIAKIKTLGNVKVITGISNVSYGLPKRSLINSTFLSMALCAGLDGALIDPLDKKSIQAIKTSEALLGRDKYCMNFIGAHRKGLI